MLALVRVKPALISIWLLANAPGQTTQDGAVPGPCAHGRDPEGARAFDLDQAGNCGHLVSEPAGTRSLSLLCLSNKCFKNKKLYTEISAIGHNYKSTNGDLCFST